MSRIDISYRRIGRITWPVLVSQLSHTAMGMIDMAMVGSLGVTALAGVGLGHFLAWWLLAFVWGMLSGVNTLVAQAYGGGRPGDAGVAFWQGVYMGLLLALGLAAMWPLVPAMLAATGATPEAQGIATDYMRIRLLGGFGLAALMASDNFYRGLGRTAVPMWCGLAQLVVNCGLNYLLIFGKLGAPRLGTAGAAWGTSAAQLVVGLTLLATIWWSREYRRDFAIRRLWRFDARLFRSLFRLSLPIGVQVFMEMGGITVFCALIAKLGDAEMAATNAVIQAWSVAFMSAFALSVTATTLVGQCIGAERPGDGREAVRRVLRLGYLLAAVMAVVYVLFPAALMALFVRQEELGRLLPFARPLFLIVVICLVFDTVFNILSGALRGAGDTRYPMLVNIGSAWLLFVPATFFASRAFGLVGAWSCLILHVAVMAALLQLRVSGRAWLRPPVAA